MMGFSIADMLSGDIVKRRDPVQDNSSAGLGQMLQFLMNSNQQPVAKVDAPQMPSLSELASISAGRRKEKQQADATEQMRQLIGTRPEAANGIHAPMLGANYGSAGSGYLKGDMPDKVLGANMMMLPDENLARNGAQLFIDSTKPRTQAQPWIGGVKGEPLMRQQNIFGPNNEVIPIGSPYRAFLDPTTYDSPVRTGSGQGEGSTSDEVTSGAFPRNSVLQKNSRGKVEVIQKAPETFTNTVDETSGATTEVNTFTGKTDTKNPTTEQSKALGSGRMSAEINKQYDALIATGFDPTLPVTNPSIFKSKFGESLQGSDNPLISTVGSSLIPDGQKAYNNIKKTWAEKYLRDESGASINPSEYATKLRNYWPETGDSQEEVIRKSERRKNAEDIASAQSPKGANQNLVQPKIINSFVKKGKTIHQGEDGKYYEEY